MAKLLYLSKKVRPNILSVVGFLCTRVKEPTIEDQVKLMRILGYLKGTKDKVMKMQPEGIFRTVAYIDASFSSAELVALSDNLGLVGLFAEFLSFVTNRKEIKPLIYQESTSVITMVMEGGGVTRTKHMRTRLHLVLEAVQQDRVEIKYANTKGMKADGLTKPLEGAEFVKFRKEAMNLPG